MSTWATTGEQPGHEPALDGEGAGEGAGESEGDGDGDGVAEGDALGDCVAADVEMSEGETVDEIGGQKRSTVPGCQAMAAPICAGVSAHE